MGNLFNQPSHQLKSPTSNFNQPSHNQTQSIQSTQPQSTQSDILFHNMNLQRALE